MSIKSVKLPIFVSRHENDSFERLFLPFLKASELIEVRTFELSYNWIFAAKDTLVQYILQGGKIRFIVSLDLEDSDLNAFILYQEAEIETIIKREILDPLKRDIPYHEQWRVQYLAFLISEGILDIRISVPKPGMFRRDRLSMLMEGKDMICFHGSFFAASEAPDAIDVFVSWDQRDHLRIQEYKRSFDEEWKNKDESLWSLPLPESIKAEFKQLKNRYNPFEYLLENKTKYKMKTYQQDLIDNLQSHDWRGMIVVPAGSAQAISTLFALDQYIIMQPRAVVLIVAPNLHAMSEWEKLIRLKYPKKQVIIFVNEEQIRDSQLQETIRLKLREDFIVVLSTYKIFVTPTFQNVFKKNRNYTFYVFDECHLLCKEDAIINCEYLEESARIGLSSSPKSWLNEKHIKYLKTIFGDEIIDYTLKNAIGKSLNEYDYIPVLCELIVPEYSEFRQLTSLAIRSLDKNKEKAENLKESINYLIQRERVLKKAYNKSVEFISTFATAQKKHVIVYVDHTQIEEMSKTIEFQFRSSTEALSSDVPLQDRAKIFKSFISGITDVIVTSDAFDEGIEALDPVAIYLLSSPTSPRVFFQRRNRILYPLQSKARTKIYDFVTIAPRPTMQDVMQIEVIKRELPRISELAKAASVSMLGQLNEYLESFHLNNVFQNTESYDLNQDIFVKEENYLE